MTEKTSRSNSLDKALFILSCFTTDSYSLTLEMISDKTSIPRSTVFRMLTSLTDYGYIRKTNISGKTWYSLGYAFLEKGQLVKRHFHIRDIAKDEMITLRNEMNMNVQLAVKDGTDAIYIEQYESWRPFRLYPSIGRKAPLYAAACPRVLLAFTDDYEQEELIKMFNFQPFTKNTVQDRNVLIKELTKIKKQGYAISWGELYEGTLAIAVPIFSPSQYQIIASISIVGLEHDFDEENDFYINKLKTAANNITSKI